MPELSYDGWRVLRGKAAARDLDAFEQIVRGHERMVLGTALRLLGRLEDAQDAAQEVFLRLYRNAAKLDEVRELNAWLYRMTVNVCHDLRKARPGHAALDGLEIAGPAAAAGSLELGEQREVIRRGLETLGVRERAALVLRDIEGLTTREVAEALGSTEATVRSQVATARIKLRKFAQKVLRKKS